MPQRETPESEELIEVRLFGGYPFAMVPKWVTALVRSGAISHGAHFTFVVLLGYADNSTGQAWPGKKTLCADVDRTDRVVTGYLRELEAARVLRVQRRPRPGNRNLPNLYHLAVTGPLPSVDNWRDAAPEDAPEPVDNPEAGLGIAPSQSRNGGEGAKYSPQGEGAAGSGDLGATGSGGTRFINELEVKEMSGGSAAPTSRVQPEPVENPAPAKAGPTVAEDFAAWWDAYRAQVRAAGNTPTGPKKTAGSAYATARRNGATAAELLDGLAAFAAGRDRDRTPEGWAPNWPHAVTWLRQGRWEEYPLGGPHGPADGPEAARASSDAFRRAEALRGPYTPPELPHDVSADDYRLAVAADRADFLAGHGRWERPTP